MRSVYPYRLALMAGALALFMRCAEGRAHLLPLSLGLLAAGAALCALLRRPEGRLLWLGLLVALLGLAGLRLAGEAEGGAAACPRGTTAVTGVVTLDSPFLEGGRTWIVEVSEDSRGAFRPGERIRVEAEAPAAGIGWGDRVRAVGSAARFRDRARTVSGALRCPVLERLEGSSRPLVAATNALRRALSGFCLEDVGGGAEGQLVAGIVLGDLGVLPGEVGVAIRRSGLSHICAASGLNVSILAAMIFYLGRRMRLARSLLYPAAMALVVMYVLVIGGKAPMVRAAVAVPLAFLAFVTAGDFHMLSAVGASLIAMLLWEPAWLHSLSFQLSFASILGIVLLTEPLSEAIKPGGGKVQALFSMTLAAQLATVPLVAGSFGEVSLTAAPANLLVVPLIPLSMGLGLAGGAIRMLRLPLAWLVARPSFWVARYVLAAAGALSAPGWATAPVGGLSWWKVASYYLVLGGVFLWRRGRPLRRPFLCLAACAALAVMAASLAGGGAGGARLVFLDVGQGDALLVEGAGGARILVDGGEDGYLLRRKLQAYGVRSIDLVILTHPDADHVGGLRAALDECAVAAVMETGRRGGRAWREWEEGVEREGAERIVPLEGEVYSLGDLDVEVMASPGPGGSGGEGGEEPTGNEGSLVLRIRGPGFSVLATGDIEEEGERALMESGRDLRADVLKVPHHGGYAETGEGFFRAVGARVSVISVGRDNRYGHPDERTLEALRRSGARTYRTDRCGDIIVEAEPGSFKVEVTAGGGQEGEQERAAQLEEGHPQGGGAHHLQGPLPHRRRAGQDPLRPEEAGGLHLRLRDGDAQVGASARGPGARPDAAHGRGAQGAGDNGSAGPHQGTGGPARSLPGEERLHHLPDPGRGRRQEGRARLEAGGPLRGRAGAGRVRQERVPRAHPRGFRGPRQAGHRPGRRVHAGEPRAGPGVPLRGHREDRPLPRGQERDRPGGRGALRRPFGRALRLRAH